MKVYRAETTIQASADAIWRILTDGPSYPDWDPGMERVEGTFAKGEKVSFYTKISPERAFPVTITTFIPGQKMVLTGGLPLGLFKSERTHLLTPQGDGSVHFSTEEIFSGLLLPLFGRSIPDLTPIFKTFLTGLKARSERGPALEST